MPELSPSDLVRLQGEIIEEMVYFGAHLPFRDQDDVTVVVKGHLLIEEQLVEYVAKRLAKPEKLERFSFDQYLRVAEALNEIAAFDWMFEACRKLNGIRNRIAHNLSPSGLEEAVAGFVDYVAKDGAALFKADWLPCNRPEFRMAIFAVYAFLRNLNRLPLLSLAPATLLMQALAAPNPPANP